MQRVKSLRLYCALACNCLIGLGLPVAVMAEQTPLTTRVIRLPVNGASKAAELNFNPIKSIDYGTFRWVVLSESDFTRLQDAGISFEDQSGSFALNLGGASFDPMLAQPSFPAGWNAARSAGKDFRLVQFVGPIRQEWLDRISAQGIQPVQYVHPYTYIVWCDPTALSAERATTSEIRWTGDFLPAYRVLPNWRNLAADDVSVKIMVYRGADATAVSDSIVALGGKLDGASTADRTFTTFEFMLPGDALQAAASIPGVYSIQPTPTDGGLRGEMSDQVNVNNVDGTNLAFPGYMTYLNGLALNGSGVIIANVDGGVQNNHPDLQNRLIACVGSTCGGATTSSHGTHTAGIMAADGTSGVLANGFLRGLGVAPGASLVEQLYSPTFQQAGGMLTLMVQSRANGAIVSGNSWGPAGTPRGYDGDTRQVDVGVRDCGADPGDQWLNFVLSFMNGNGGTSTQGTPDEGKNIFTIGSTKMQSSPTVQILQINDISSNSAHGPALDGRKIPHMVAPGCSVDSTVSTSTHTTMCGTSMASPHVSGAVALFYQYYRGLPDYTTDATPALVKAAFLPAARDLAGNLDADNGILGHPFDNKQGWGRMDLDAVINPQVSVVYFDNPQVFDNTGEQWTRVVSAADPSKPVKIMLAWTDAPGHGLGGSTPAWNNNLDLIVEDGPNTYRGNVFNASGWSQTGGTADDRNNTEGIFIGPTAPGSYTVRVVASNISSDGLPNSGDTTDQDFSLVCYNCAQDPTFTLTMTPAAQSICAPDDAVYNVNIGQIMGFSDDVDLDVTVPAPLTGNFSDDPVTPPGSSTLTIGNTGAASAGAHSITVTATSGAIVRNANVTLNLYTAAPAPPSLITPANGATGVALRPNFSWVGAVQPTTYDIQIATDSGFTNVVQSASGLASPNFTPGADLANGTLHYWRVRGNNVCGTGAYSAASSFTTRIVPAILLVDDDDNGPDARSYYTTALTALGQDYDIWDTNNTDNEPTAAQLSPYSVVIWFTGDEFGGACGPGAAGEAALAAWLDTGKCLFISSQDYLYDRDNPTGVPTAFMQNYLGMASPGTNDVSQTTVTGVVGSLFAGMGPYALTYPFTNFSDRISPNATAQLAFTGNAGDAAIYKNSGVYQTVFFGFPWEALPTAAARQAVLEKVLTYCVPTCNGARGDMNGQSGVNGQDIQKFIDCYLGGTPNVSGCPCSDMDYDNALSSRDVSEFVKCLLGITCP